MPTTATKEPEATKPEGAEATTTGSAEDRGDGDKPYDAAAAYREIMGDDHVIDSNGDEDDDEREEKPPAKKAEEPAAKTDGDDEEAKKRTDEEAKKLEDEEKKADDSLITIEELELPKLDPELAKNPDVLKRVQAFESGIKKRVDQVNQLFAETKQTAEDLSYMVKWHELLSAPETIPRGLAVAVDHLAKEHSLDAEELLSGLADAVAELRGAKGTAKTEPSKKTEPVAEFKGNQRYKDWDDEELDLSVESQRAELEARIKHRAETAAAVPLAAMQKQLDEMSKALVAIGDERKKSKAESDWDRAITAAVPELQKSLKAKENGFEVTEAQIRQAATELPQIWEKDKERAVRMHLADELKEHTAKVVAGQHKKKPPELPERASVTGAVKKTPEEYKAADAYAEMQAEEV